MKPRVYLIELGAVGRMNRESILPNHLRERWQGWVATERDNECQINFPATLTANFNPAIAFLVWTLWSLISARS